MGAVAGGAQALPLGGDLEGAAVQGAGQGVHRRQVTLVLHGAVQRIEQHRHQGQHHQLGERVPNGRQGQGGPGAGGDLGQEALGGGEHRHQDRVAAAADPGDGHHRQHVEQVDRDGRAGQVVEAGHCADQHDPQEGGEQAATALAGLRRGGAAAGTARCGGVAGHGLVHRH
ncbi:MAG: hypothetical protein MUE66_07250 [Acidimicrobiia bacterium]|nr:hypothetical protein [Acidimicrobiia bacterium]